MARTREVTARAPSTRVVLGVLILMAPWSALVVLFPDVGFMVGAVLTLLVLLPGAVAGVWAIRAWRGRRPAGMGARLALLLVPVLALATTAVVLLDDGYRDTIRWRLSRSAFEGAAADLATSTPDVGTFHGDRLVGFVWIDSIEVYGDTVLFHLPGFIDHAVVAKGADHAVPGELHLLGPLGGDWDGWYRYWFHF